MNSKNDNRDIMLKRDIISFSQWRSTQTGMWAWILQRFSALALIVLVVLHLVYPYQVYIQTLMVIFICFHGVLGIRVIILDLNKRVFLQRVLFGVLMAIGVVLIFLILKYRVFYF